MSVMRAVWKAVADSLRLSRLEEDDKERSVLLGVRVGRLVEVVRVDPVDVLLLLSLVHPGRELSASGG